eukprot:TRINITY_DN29227_c0_g1_i3.p1 TRINITY_DN29227_c0_g1~~TRINITY_DN29227_c0_g1_i3.p1  ORF type:complete len:462 (+),score=84.37 TRINITY_DN29227_c0_g1_i3:55-1440(+)
MEIALSLEGEDVQIVEVALDSASSALLRSAEELFRLAPGTAELFFEGDLLGEAGLEEVGLTQGCTVLVKPKPGVVARSVLRNDYGIVNDHVGTLRKVLRVPAESMSPEMPHKVSNLALAILSDTSCDVPVALSSALADAVRHSHPACVESLLAAGVSPKGPALLHAAQQGDVDSLRFLLSAIEDLPTPAERTAVLDGMDPPFTTTTAYYKFEPIQAYRPVNSSNPELACEPPSRTTALMEAASNGHAVVVQILLTAGADPGVARYSRTAEMLAASNRHLGVLRVFGSSRAPGRDRYGGSCLTHAIQGPTDADAVASGFTPLSCVEFLLSEMPTDELRTAMVNARRVDRRTPLILAAQEGLVDVMTLLLQHGADIGASDNRGWTPLATACVYGFLDAADFLLRQGADLNTLDEMGYTPLSLFFQYDVLVAGLKPRKYGFWQYTCRTNAAEAVEGMAICWHGL